LAVAVIGVYVVNASFTEPEINKPLVEVNSENSCGNNQVCKDNMMYFYSTYRAANNCGNAQ